MDSATLFDTVLFSYRFAHLINIDFFSDLMSILHSLAETGVYTYGEIHCCYLILLYVNQFLQGLSNRECMQCVLAAFEILSGQGMYVHASI